MNNANVYTALGVKRTGGRALDALSFLTLCAVPIG
jgi:hypothetical protein